ncbi:class I SAM-dependent methyltransferase [Plectonema radiosum]|nr:class I SAM-dependent methyltransferase [Plectonema radiosum]
MDLLVAAKDQLAMEYLRPLHDLYIPWSESAIRPSGMVKILNEILIYKRRCIVECGGGVSTIFIAKMLKMKGGHLYTIENDKEWSIILKQQIDELGLTEYVTLINAPLAKSDLSIGDLLWYDQEIIRNQIDNLDIDFLIVDGPLAYLKEIQYSRYPAVPFFRSYFAKDYSIALDDINRFGEREIIKKWKTLTGIQFDRFFIDGGIAIGRTNKTFTT